MFSNEYNLFPTKREGKVLLSKIQPHQMSMGNDKCPYALFDNYDVNVGSSTVINVPPWFGMLIMGEAVPSLNFHVTLKLL